MAGPRGVPQEDEEEPESESDPAAESSSCWWWRLLLRAAADDRDWGWSSSSSSLSMMRLRSETELLILLLFWRLCWLNRFSGSPSGLDDETASALRGVGSSAQLRAQSSSSLQFSSKLRATPWLVSLLATSPPPTWPPHHHGQDKKHDLISSYIIV